ncbi:MAG: mercuric transport protein [Rhodoferax sp.]|nr:mercuric transport protein [Rhodoferax sp.]
MLNTTPALALAAIAALLASTCCVLPLLLVLLGISGAWIGQLRWFEPYSTALMVLAIGSLSLAAWRLFRSCNANGMECRKVHVAARRWFWLVALLTLIPLLVPLAAPLFY